ncbi:MAG: cytochrome d ubiquinol oxidase subunit II [Candidatus Omnitrophica bacterium CG1_02_46_14]|nr:MAG: cytochrome d ubiquinol oxidase subunit II [Candidatus Omnitrophica bacterium CG1_02_46_14]
MTLDLNIIWFVLVGILFTGYALLDGFDLGVGALHLFTKTDGERRLMMNSIGPVWDGNEVWLVTGGGALFAAFPDVYATVFSGFYLGFILLLAALIFRAVAIEFRSKHKSPVWRASWDISFCFASILTSFLIGLVMGNIVRGIPLGADKEYTGSFFDLFNLYSILMGVTVVSLFMMHGAIYAVMKIEGALHEKLRFWVNRAIIFFIMCYATVTMVTLLYVPHMTETLKTHPVFFFVAFLNMLAIANIPREIARGRDFQAFLSSCAAIAALMALFGLGMFPNLVYSLPHPEFSLTIYNAASSAKTLLVMFIMTGIGIPVVLAYTISIYWIFRGKVKLDNASY